MPTLDGIMTYTNLFEWTEYEAGAAFKFEWLLAAGCLILDEQKQNLSLSI